MGSSHLLTPNGRLTVWLSENAPVAPIGAAATGSARTPTLVAGLIRADTVSPPFAAWRRRRLAPATNRLASPSANASAPPPITRLVSLSSIPVTGGCASGVAAIPRGSLAASALADASAMGAGTESLTGELSLEEGTSFTAVANERLATRELPVGAKAARAGSAGAGERPGSACVLVTSAGGAWLTAGGWTMAISGTTIAGTVGSGWLGIVATTTGAGSAASCATDGVEATATAMARTLPAERAMEDAFFMRAD